MKKILLLAAFCAAVFSNAQTTIYSADFSNNGDGFPDHTSGSPPVAGPTSVGPFGVSPNSWELSYTTTPSTDGSANSFKIVAGELQSDDWGGQGIFISQNIDVSSISLANISATGVNSGANDDNFTYFYILDGGSRVETPIGVSNNGDPINYSVVGLDVSGATSLLVGFEFSENGAGDGYDISAFQVSGTSSSGNPAPSITNISNTPVSPTSSDAVTIEAEVTDADGIASVELQYGFAIGVYDQTPIMMNVSTGDTYTASIAAQADGTNVFYQIVAIDSNTTPATSTSPEQTYLVMDPIPAPSLIITEVADPSDDFTGRYVEVYNNGVAAIDFSTTTVFIATQSNGAGISSNALTGILNPGEYYLIGNSSNLQTAYGVPADLDFGSINGNGNDGYFLYVGGDENNGTLFDSYGVLNQDGNGQPWNYLDSRAVRNSITDMPSDVWQAASWTITGANVEDMTPKEGESVNYIYNGSSWIPMVPEGNATTSDNITVQSGSIAFTGDLDARTITVEDIASLNLGSNTINLARNLNAVGTASITGDLAILNLAGTEAQQINTDLSLEGLILNNANGATLNGMLSLNGVLTLTNGTLITNDNLTLKSVAGKSAIVAPVVSGSVTGDVVVEQYYSNKRAFRFAGSTVDMTATIFDNWQQGGLNPGDLGYESGVGTAITGGSVANGFDQSVTNASSMFSFNNTTQSWEAFSDTNASGLVPGQATRIYIRGDRSVSLTTSGPAAASTETVLTSKGALNNGEITISGLSTVEGEFNFISNPYQAQVDLTSLFADAATADVNPNLYYAWDPTIGTNGAYSTYSFSSNTNNVAGSEVDQFLQPGQAIFIVTAEDGVAAGINPSIVFKESFKTISTDTNNVFRNSNSTSLITISAFKDNEFATGRARDGVVLSFNANGNNQLDANDAAKWQNPDENLSVETLGVSLSITERELPLDGEIIPLKFDGLTGSNYTFELNNSLSDLQTIFVDGYLGTETILNQGNNLVNISFDNSLSGSIASNRFSLKFENAVLSVNDSAFAKAVKVYPNPVSNTNLTISDLIVGEAVTIDIFNTAGQKVVSFENSSSSGEETLSDTISLKSGMYFLHVSQLGVTATQKLIKK